METARCSKDVQYPSFMRMRVHYRHFPWIEHGGPGSDSRGWRVSDFAAEIG